MSAAKSIDIKKSVVDTVRVISESRGWSVSLSTMEPNGCRFHVELNPVKT